MIYLTIKIKWNIIYKILITKGISDDLTIKELIEDEY